MFMTPSLKTNWSFDVFRLTEHRQKNEEFFSEIKYISRIHYVLAANLSLFIPTDLFKYSDK